MSFVECDSPYFVDADRTRLKQILINILSNAVKYNKRGGTVVVGCGTLTTPNRIRVTVTDSGAGLPPEKLAQLFQPFNRLGQQATTEQGTGIGLVVTKRLVELMGGTIGVSSTVGTGSVFWFELGSIAAPKSAAEVEAARRAQPVLAKESLVRTLLYVEDNPANLQLVQQLIARRADMRFLTAEDGNAGVELARSSQPDVILMDIHLPGISGIEALTILRADPTTAHIPIIALSANAIPRDIEKGLEAGFCRYLTKPIKVDHFMDALDEALALAAVGIPRNQ
jgi:CheY-like chemotaxis protein